MSCKLLKKCLKCQILFSGKINKNITNLSSVEFAKRVVKVYEGHMNIFYLISVSDASMCNYLLILLFYCTFCINLCMQTLSFIYWHAWFNYL